MKLELFLATFTLFSLASCQSSDFTCYDCIPSDSFCISPEQNNAKSTNCQEQHEREATTSSYRPSVAEELECFVLYVNVSGYYEKGHYRGCYSKRTGETTCTLLKQTYGQDIACTSCTTSLCNIKNFDGSDNNGSTAVTLSAAILIIHLVLFVRIL